MKQEHSIFEDVDDLKTMESLKRLGLNGETIERLLQAIVFRGLKSFVEITTCDQKKIAQQILGYESCVVNLSDFKKFFTLEQILKDVSLHCGLR